MNFRRTKNVLAIVNAICIVQLCENENATFARYMNEILGNAHRNAILSIFRNAKMNILFIVFHNETQMRKFVPNTYLQ